MKMKLGTAQLRHYRLGRLGWNTLFGTGGLGVRAVVQAGYLLVLSRWLGASGFGLFAGSVALAVLVAPLANWGSPLLLTRHIACDPGSSRGMWATALSQTGVIGGLLSLGLLLVAGFTLRENVGFGTMAMLAAAELILLPAAQAATSQCFALERGLAGGACICLVPVARLSAAVAMLAGGMDGTPMHAAIAHFMGSLAGLLAALGLVAVVDGWPDWSRRLRIGEAMRQGTQYAVGGLVGNSYQELDKVLMLQLLGAAIVGSYTASFRVVSVFVMPVAALVGATLPRLMALHGKPDQARTYRAMVMAAAAYGVLASLGSLSVAPFMPALFGPGYEATSHLVMLLAPWPLVYALHQSAATALTATGRQGVRVGIEAAGLVLVGVLNLVLLRSVGAAGSAYALLTAEAMIALGCWVALSCGKRM